MALRRYTKAQPIVHTRRIPSYVSFVCVLVGSGILVWVGWPIISFSLFTAPKFAQIISPLPDIAGESARGIAPKVLAAEAQGTVSEQDYTNANTWFPGRPQTKTPAPVPSYRLSIPKLEVENAAVIIGGEDLNKSLIHYGGTGLPGEYGKAVIFGHSVLPQFFNPKDYKSIFSTLPTLKIGDNIFITYDNVTYRYAVYDITIHEPEDLSILEQKFDDSYISLITCVPPGTYLKRLNVKARLQRL